MFEFIKSPSPKWAHNEVATEAGKAFFPNTRFVVTEQIQGLGMSAVTDGDKVQFAHSQGFLDESTYHGFETIAPLLQEKMLAMFSDIRAMVNAEHDACDALEADGIEAVRPPHPRDISELRLFFTLYGGDYPYPGVPQLPGMYPVMSTADVWYCQDVSIGVHLMLINGHQSDFYEMGALCMSYGIPVVPALFFGTLNECLAYSKEHIGEPTTIPDKQPLLDVHGNYTVSGDELVGLPAISGNSRAGHLILPTTPVVFADGTQPIFIDSPEDYEE